jgi:prolyl 4-hydroxylase
VEEGGETVFPFANGDDRRVMDFADCSRGLKVKPKAGSAIIFYSLLADKQQMVCPEDNLGCNLDVRSLHGGCDVIKGEKWAANYWIANKL